MRLSGDDPLDVRPRGLNVTTGDLDVLVRLAEAQREAKAIAGELIGGRRGSKKDERHEFGRRLNALAASLKTIEMVLGGELGAPGLDVSELAARAAREAAREDEGRPSPSRP